MSPWMYTREMGWAGRALAAGIVALACVSCTSLGGLAGGEGDAGPGPMDAPAQGSCRAGEKVCGRACAALTDPAHGCGSPECSPCAGAKVAGFVCKAGACAVDTCATGAADCDRDVTNGCEADLGTGATCGACTTSCPTAAPICNVGECVTASSCTSPRQVCGTACVDPMTDPAHCGDQCTFCPAPSGRNAVATCQQGQCALKCTAGFSDCNRIATDGCECAGGCSGNACCTQPGCVADSGADAANPPSYLCPGSFDGGSTVSSCALCPGLPQPCVGCVQNVATQFHCAAAGVDCTSLWPAGTNICSCSVAADCKIPQQVCAVPGGGCRTCGEMLTKTLTCQDGTKCSSVGTCN